MALPGMGGGGEEFSKYSMKGWILNAPTCASPRARKVASGKDIAEIMGTGAGMSIRIHI